MKLGDDTQATPDLKLKTARSLKWNTVDRVSSQVLYALIGIVLANVLSPVDFGLVGVILVFQAFGIILVDSGFGAALLQKKEPNQADYSTVFWFNTLFSIALYVLLFAAAPLIADIFNDARLITLSRVMLLSIIINGLAIVQTNRLMKQMNVKMIAVANLIGLSVSGVIAIILAVKGYGAQALVWQTIILAIVKTSWLWLTGGWHPSFRFSAVSMRSIRSVGLGVFTSTLLNTICQNIYSFIIGAFFNMSRLGYYTQADKWSKMGSASISQIFTSSFVPLLSSFQDDADRFRRYMKKINKLAALIIMPAMIGLAALGYPLFHALFGEKWDAAVPLFQILAVRGIFIILISLLSNYLLSLGKSKLLVAIESVKDILILVAIVCTLPLGSVEWLVWGQLFSSIATFAIALRITSKATSYPALRFIGDLAPYAALATAAGLATIALDALISNAWLSLTTGLATGAGIFFGLLYVCGNEPLHEAISYAAGRFRKRGI